MNYQHLHYFRTVAALGGVTAAANQLRLTPPTLSAQIRALEESLGVVLFERTSRGMNLTDEGHVALRYAEKIFALGAELERVVGGTQERKIHVGVETSTVASAVRPLLARLALGSERDRVVCSFRTHDELLASLKTFDLDVVLTRSPIVSGDVPGIECRLLLEAEIAFFADARTARELQGAFPNSLSGASFIAPPRSPFRESIERWFAQMGLTMQVPVELGDASMAAALAADGVGLVAAPTTAGPDLAKRYDLERVGVAEGLIARIYALGSAKTLNELLPALRLESAS